MVSSILSLQGGEAVMARADHEGPDSFPTTNWTFVRQAAEDSAPGRPTLNELLRRYRPVLWAHLVYKRGVPKDEADDLVQEFIQRKILEGDILRRADRNRGKLRTYLLTALDNFLVDCRRKKAATPAAELTVDVSDEAGPDSDVVVWAMQAFIEGLRRMRAECEAKRRPDLWGIFAARFLGPLVGEDLVPYPVLVAEFGLDSAHQASIRFTTAKAMFHRNLRAVLIEDGEEEIEDQVLELERILCQASAELVEQLRIHLWNDVPEVTASMPGRSPIDPAALARMLQLQRLPAERAELLRHLLTAPVPLDLGAVDAALAERVRGWAEEQGLVLKSFGDLLHHPNPLPELLELVKEFAKENIDDDESPLPPKVATVLYYASIAVALARCGRRITRHDDATLRHGFLWGCQQPWVDEATCGLLREGLRALGGADEPSG